MVLVVVTMRLWRMVDHIVKVWVTFVNFLPKPSQGHHHDQPGRDDAGNQWG